MFFLVGQEKAPYEAKAAKRKSEYEKLMNAYNKKQVISFFLQVLTWISHKKFHFNVTDEC